MFLIRRPDHAFVQRIVDSQRDQPLMYADVGMTRKSKTPIGFYENKYQAVIGSGEKDYAKAKKQLNEFRMLDLDWIKVVAKPSGIVEGALVATLIRQFGIYSLNVARIVYTELDSDHRFGFGYGTLSEYPVYGEERFSVVYDAASGNVSYEIYSFAKPATMLTKIGWRFVRKVQQRFGPASCDAMRIGICGVDGE